MIFKKYSKIIVATIVFIFALTIGAIVYNVKMSKEDINSSTNSNQTMKVKLYFIDANNSKLVEEERTISKGTGSKEDITSNILETLISGPKNQSYKKSIPDSVSILDVELNGETANVNLSAPYNELKASDALFCRASLVYTLTDIEFIKDVKILTNGSELLKANGEVLGAMSKDDIVITNVVTPELAKSEIVKLYFSNSDASELIIEEREIEITLQQNEQKAKAIMEQIIVGPKNSDLVVTVPAETKIRDIKIRDGICYLDLSKEFIERHSGGSSGEWVTINSIVNSLTEIDEIKKVQFLIEGEKQQEFKGHVDFSKPFEREIK